MSLWYRLLQVLYCRHRREWKSNVYCYLSNLSIVLVICIKYARAIFLLYMCAIIMLPFRCLDKAFLMRERAREWMNEWVSVRGLRRMEGKKVKKCRDINLILFFASSCCGAHFSTPFSWMCEIFKRRRGEMNEWNFHATLCVMLPPFLKIRLFPLLLIVVTFVWRSGGYSWVLSSYLNFIWKFEKLGCFWIFPPYYFILF